MPGEDESTRAQGPRWSHRWRVVVRDRSMEPHLLPGDRLRVDLSAFEHRAPARGDVVVLRDPETPGRWLIKRVTGIPGDFPEGARSAVPAGHLFVAGDRLTESRDSRTFGPVPQSSIVGRADFRYGPPDRRGPLDGSSLK